MKGIADLEFIIFDKSSGRAGMRKLKTQLKHQRFQILLHMHASMRANLISRHISADRKIGYDRLRAKDYQWLFTSEKIIAKPNQHVLDGMFGFVEHLGLNERELRWEIPVENEDREFAQQVFSQPGPAVLISPCSSSRFRNYRNWRVDRFVELGKRLVDKHDAQIIVTGGSSTEEHEYADAMQSQIGAAVTNLVGKTSLKQLLALCDAASVVVCPDSGPAHIATTVGTPVVGLYATSNRRRTGPYFSQHLVIDHYPAAAQAEFKRPVEALRWGQRVRDPEAMDRIEVDEVFDKMELVLNAQRSGQFPALDPG